MAAGSPQLMVRHLRQMVQCRDVAALTDGQLLECFIAEHDEAAFAGLVRRHGPMVWGVCRRVVGHAQDAEDAFQATFLVLVRKAVTVRPREQVGNWLYGVAHRTALKCKIMSLRRRSKEKQVAAAPEAQAGASVAVADWVPVLDRELSQLPEKYRLPIVLCDLEGRTRRDVARQLKLPDGTLSNRLAAGRRLLARRLTRHGVTLSGAALAAALLAESATARVPAPLLIAAIRTATENATAGTVSTTVTALTEGVLKTMLLNKLKLTAVVVTALGSLTIGAGLLLAPAPRAVADPPGTTLAKDLTRPITDRDRLQGAWTLVSAIVDGKRVADEALKRDGEQWVFVGDKFLVLRADRPGRVTDAGFLIDSARTPKTFDYVPREGPDKGKICPGIYRLDDDILIVCDDSVGKVRPAKLESRAGANRVLIFRRAHAGPSQRTPDADFLKRACQDLRGTLPTHLERNYFLADKDADKRAKVLGWLVHMPADLRASFSQTIDRFYVDDLANTLFVYPQLNNLNQIETNPYFLNQLHDTVNPGPTLFLGAQLNANTLNSTTLANWYWPNSHLQPYLITNLTVDDATFLRRIMLDMFGVPATPLEMQYFLADKDSNKRQKVVGWLAQAPGYQQRLAFARWHTYPQLAAVDFWTKETPPTSAAKPEDRLQQLLVRLFDANKKDAQILEALTLATMARFPTDSERSFILAHVGRQQDRRAAWNETLQTLRNTGEAKQHAAYLGRGAALPR